VSRLPRISGREAVRAFEKAGWQVIPRRGKGDHMILRKAGNPHVLSVPDHPLLGPGLLRSLVRLSGLTVEEFAGLL
jgi:predicted RNA binding protein YcfA (HicA-like mRNA interferase family)